MTEREPNQPKSIVALKEWEDDTGKPATASEGNAFIDGFNAGFEDKWDAEYRRGKMEAEAEVRELREALVAAVPFLFEHGSHQNTQCYRGSDDGCHCGLDDAKKLAESVLARERH